MAGSRDGEVHSSASLRALADSVRIELAALSAVADEMDECKVARITVANRKAVLRMKEELNVVIAAAKRGYTQAQAERGFGVGSGTDSGTDCPKQEPTQKDLRRRNATKQHCAK
jgi:hypothetical protein